MRLLEKGKDEWGYTNREGKIKSFTYRFILPRSLSNVTVEYIGRPIQGLQRDVVTNPNGSVTYCFTAADAPGNGFKYEFGLQMEDRATSR